MLLSIYRAFVALATFCFVVFLFQGLLTGDIAGYFPLVGENILVAATLADLYFSLSLACVMISVFERKWWVGVLLFIPCVFIGGPTIGIYLLWRLPAMMRAVGIEIAPENNA